MLNDYPDILTVEQLSEILGIGINAAYRLVNDGTILENDTEYLRAVAVGDLAKARGLENMDRLIARDPVYAAMVYV